ncbi:hypothetical protein Aab01nite_63120 [Paractinoplanes abujensis]|nr:hypothetical protein Aab01nite_63120 [Actinoplanes abujensis]
MLWRDVLVSDHVVGSDGLTAEVGGVVEMSLHLHCRELTLLGKDEPPGPRVPEGYGEPGQRWVQDLVGQVAEGRSGIWADGWVLDVDGLALYVDGTAVPEPGGWVRATGELSIAEAYETDAFEPGEELVRKAERSWLVRRIVRVDRQSGGPGARHRTRHVEVDVMRFGPGRRRGGWWTVGYLLDLDGAAAAP